MPGIETLQKRYFTPAWGKPHRQECLVAGCDNVMLIEQLDEGTIWACGKCHVGHEFYTEYVLGPGGTLKYGVVRILKGDHVRTSGEPTILEFMEDLK